MEGRLHLTLRPQATAPGRWGLTFFKTERERRGTEEGGSPAMLTDDRDGGEAAR